MKSSILIYAIVIGVAFYCQPGFSQVQNKPLIGSLDDGTPLDKNSFDKILSEHWQWLNEKGGKRAIFDKADFERSSLYGKYLKGVSLCGANLKGVDLGYANLEGAWLNSANLKGASLIGTNLKEAMMDRANLEGVIFEIEPNNLPDIVLISRAVNLSLLRYDRSPHALVELREAFKKYGLRRQEREITYAIKHSGYLNAKSWGDLPTKIQVLFGWLLFDLTCKWGMAPMQPLAILVIFIGLFSPFYIFSLKKRNKLFPFFSYSLKKQQKKDGIWKTWIPERARRDLGGDEPELMTCNWMGAIGNGLYFSMLAAFHVGWRDLNVGSWIARMQPQEYRLHASGWVRFVSGLQSLISVYLLALCILTYFGRPFESY
jgi:hypothetical protein